MSGDRRSGRSTTPSPSSTPRSPRSCATRPVAVPTPPPSWRATPDPGARRRWTYAELLADALIAARALAARFEPGERVAVIATAVPESLLLSYGAALAGVVLVPVNPALRAGELRHVLGQSGAAGAFVVPDYRGHDVMATVTGLRGDAAGVAPGRRLGRLGGVLRRCLGGR